MTRKRKLKLRTAADLTAAGRAHSREMLESELEEWRHCWFFTHPTDRTTYVVVGDNETIAKFKFADLERDMSADHLALFNALYEQLKWQASVANYAVTVAQTALASVAGAKAGGDKTGRATSAEAQTRAAKIQKVAADIGPAKNEYLAEQIAERDSKLGKASTIVKKLPPKRKKKPLKKL